MKMEIYTQTMGIITKIIFKSFVLYIVVWQKTVLEMLILERILMICVNGSLQQYYITITSMSIDYKE